MLPAWATVTLTLGAAFITGLVAIVVPFIQERLRARREAEEARETRRRKALELAVQVRAVAEEANVGRYSVNTSKEHYEYLQKLAQRLAEANDPFVALAADDTDETLLADVREAVAAARGSIHATALCVADMMQGRAPSQEFMEAAMTRDPDAIAKADALIGRFRPSANAD